MQPAYGKVSVAGVAVPGNTKYPQKLEAKTAESRYCEVKLTRTKGERISDAKIADLFILILPNR